MNKQQFEIVKAMQSLGVTAKRFANACRADYALMVKAFNAANYELFLNPPERQAIDMDAFESIFGR